ncbi:MAG: hypothetical protein ACLUOI_31705 [Eisenbergiella sp.]
MQDGTAGTLLLCERKEDVQKLWTDSAPAVTEETLRLAQERCGYSADALSQEPVVKASMTLRAHGETRKKRWATGRILTVCRKFSENHTAN